MINYIQKNKPYYFSFVKDKKVLAIEGGLFVFPESEVEDWQLWNNGSWWNPICNNYVRCDYCDKEFNRVHEGLYHGEYDEHFCDAMCEVNWFMNKHDSHSDALYIWKKERNERSG